jgi:hypothetical protein
MSDDHKGPTSHRGRRSAADAVSSKCVACASSIVAGIAGVGLSWLPGSELKGTAVTTRVVGDIALTTSADPLMNEVIVLPGADDTIVLPSGNVINLPFGGDGFNNFFGPGIGGVAGGASAADSAAGTTWTDFTTPVEQFTIPFLNDTIVLPGSNDTFDYLSGLTSGNAINLPFFGNGENDFFGAVFPQTGTALSDSGVAVGNADNLSIIPTESLPTDATVLPGSADTIEFPSFNTINFPLGGVGENNFFGGGNGGDGGVGTGIGVGGNSAADPLTTAATGTTTVSQGVGETTVFPSFNTINFPFGGVGENNFFGGGNGGNGGAGTGIGIGGSGADTTGTGIGIGGAGGAGGNGAEFFPIHVNFIDSSGASSATSADVSGASSATSAGSLDSLFNEIFGSNGTLPVVIATGTGIGIGGAGGAGGNGAEIFPINIDVNTADLGGANSSALVAFLDSLPGGGSSSALASLVSSASGGVAGGTSVSIDGPGGAGGDGAEFFPIYLDWADASGAHSIETSPSVLLDSLVGNGVLGSGATDSAAIPTSFLDELGGIPASISTELGSSSSLFAGDLGAGLPALVADLGGLF